MIMHLPDRVLRMLHTQSTDRHQLRNDSPVFSACPRQAALPLNVASPTPLFHMELCIVWMIEQLILIIFIGIIDKVLNKVDKNSQF